MKRIRASQSKKIQPLQDYTFTSTSLSTIVDRKTMEEIQYDLDNPTSGTASLSKLLKEIDCAR